MSDIQPQPTGQPIYTLPQKKVRLLFPHLFTLILLSFIFYLGILLNLSLLNISLSTETTVKLSSLALLFIIIITGFLFSLKKAKRKYLFYPNRITFNRQQISLKGITELNQTQNFLDKLFQTYSLTLNKEFEIKNIPKDVPLADYLQKLISYAQSQPLS